MTVLPFPCNSSRQFSFQRPEKVLRRAGGSFKLLNLKCLTALTELREWAGAVSRF